MAYRDDMYGLLQQFRDGLVDSSGQTVTPTGATTARAQADWLADQRNVLAFGTVAEMLSDGTAAFQRAVDSIPSGKSAVIVVPGLPSGQDYVLSGTVSDNGRTPYWNFLPGASVTGGISAKFAWPTRRVSFRNGRSPLVEHVAASDGTAFGGVIGDYDATTNTGQSGSYGRRHDHVSSSFYGTGFDIAQGILATWDRTSGQNGGQMLSHWVVALSPQVADGSTDWGVFCTELNIVNRGADTGWAAKRATLENWSGCLQLVCEASTFGKPGTPYNATYASVIGPSSANKPDGIPGQFYNGILCEPNAIAGGTGRLITASGNDTGIAARDPYSVLDLRETWERGIRTVDATIVSGLAHEMPVGHGIGWVDGSDNILSALRVGAPVHKTGRFYSTFEGPGAAAAIGAVDTIYLFPFRLNHPVLVKTLHTRVGTGGAGSSVKTAIWANSVVSDRPLGAPLIADNTGQATTSNNSNTTANVADTLLQPGWYWCGSKFTGTLPSMLVVPANNQFFSFYMGSNSGGGLVICGKSFADAYANDMPTFAEGATFADVTTSTISILQLGT